MEPVAVILPVYHKDRVDYLTLSIESILNQTYHPIELFIGVDGPVSKPLQLCLEQYDILENVSIVWFKENRGLACVLNDLLDICFNKSFSLIARMDADDISEPDRILKQVEYLSEHKEVDVVGGAIKEIDEDGKERGKVIIYPETPEECRRFFSLRNPHAHPAVLFRKSFFDKLRGGKYRSEYRQNQDTMLWYDGMKVGTMHANIQEVVLLFRITDATFKKRRNGWAFAKQQLNDRKKINAGLGYGIMAYLFAYAMFVLLVSPVWIKKIAYKVFR